MNYWFQYDTTTGVIYPYLQDNSPASSAQMGVLGPYPQDSASPTVVMSYTYPQRFKAQGSPVALVEQPYLTVSATDDANQWTITATLNNPPATPPTSVTFTVCGQTFAENVSGGQASLTLNIHPSLEGQQIQISVGATGCVDGITMIGTASSVAAIQAYQSGSYVNVSPTSKAFLAEYWASTVPQAYNLGDIATALNLLMDTVFNVILPKLTSGTTPIVTLDTNQTNGFSDLQANVLTNIMPTLETIVPETGSPDPHYTQYKADTAPMKQAMQNYANDLATIPNLA